MGTPPLVGLDAILAAREVLAPVVRLTPCEGSRVLSDAVGGPVMFKCENLQRTGSFKLRGAYVRMAGLNPAERATGVVAASAGNHGQGVALAAALLGISATVYMPERAPLPKVEATLGYGARVVLVGQTVDEALQEAARDAAATGAVLVHPFDHPDVIAGQGTIGLEILEQVPDVATVVVCAGGGGLVSGIAAAVKGRRSDVEVVAVQAEEAPSIVRALAAGSPVALSRMATMADGIAVGQVGHVTLRHVQEHVDRVLTVSEEQLSRALLLCLERAKLVVEPAGAAAAAAVLADPHAFRPPVVVVLSGGNIDPLLLDKVIRHGLVAAGRFLSLRVTMPDAPGSLAALLEVLASASANVLDVEHVRTAADLGLGDVEVGLRVETRGPEHCTALLDRLRAVGYRLG